MLKLQCVQNYLALLKSLHWLPIQSHINFKLCTIAYQTLSSGEPSYLFSMHSLASNPRKLRSSGFHLLYVPRIETHAGTRAFSIIVVPTLWNSVPEQVIKSHSFFTSPFENSPFQTYLSFLSFYSI